MKNKKYFKIIVIVALFIIIALVSYININKQENKAISSEPIQREKKHSVIEKYNFIYSHPDYNNSNLVSSTDGLKFKNNALNIKDISNIQYNKLKKSLELIQMYNSGFYSFNSQGHLDFHKVQDPITYSLDTQNLSIISYNHDMDTNILEVKDNNKSYKLQMPSYLRSITFDKKNIYVLSDVASVANRSILFIIDRSKQEIIKEIEMDSSASDIKFFNNNLIVATDYGLNIISLNEGYNSRNISFQRNNIKVDKLHIYNNKLYLLYGNFDDGSANVFVFNTELKRIIDQKISTDAPYTSGKFLEDKLFILVQYELTEKKGGQFIIYNLSNMETENTFLIPKEKVKVQDFIVKN